MSVLFIACISSIPQSWSALRGESPTVIGDARQIGLSGASLTTPDSVHTAMENPANAYFEKWSATLALLNSEVRDNRMNGNGITRRSEGMGLAASSPKFGIYFGHRMPAQESGPLGKVEVQESHLGAALGINQLALGISLISARADWKGFSQPDAHASAWSVGLGARYRFTDRFQAGLSFRPSVPIQHNSSSSYWSLVEIPARLQIGTSFSITDKFSIHGSIAIFGKQDDTVSLAEPGREAARAISTQHRLGIEYEIFNEGITSLSAYAGTYLEPARIEGLSTRCHYTAGTGLKVWAGRASFAFDRASGYKNIIATIGIDILDLLVKVKVIPVPEN